VRIEFGKVGKEGMSGIVQFEKNNPESLLTALEAVEAQTDYKGKS
jgi:predicted DNA-binding WGR domain protein